MKLNVFFFKHCSILSEKHWKHFHWYNFISQRKSIDPLATVQNHFLFTERAFIVCEIGLSNNREISGYRRTTFKSTIEILFYIPRV